MPRFKLTVVSLNGTDIEPFAVFFDARDRAEAIEAYKSGAVLAGTIADCEHPPTVGFRLIVCPSSEEVA